MNIFRTNQLSRLRSMQDIVYLSSEDEESTTSDEAVLEFKASPLDGTVYGLGIISLIRAGRKMAISKKPNKSHVLVLLTPIFVIIMCLFLQFYVLLAVSEVLVAGTVNKMQLLYHDFEQQMSTNSTNLYDYNRFLALSVDMKTSICEIPLSHPKSSGAMLLIFTFTCFVELRQISHEAYRILVRTPTISSLEDSLGSQDGEVSTVRGLTVAIKVLISVLIFLPRFSAVAWLLVLGFRWLVASSDLGEVIMNVVALEFVLMLKTLLYESMVPLRLKVMVETTLIKPSTLLVDAKMPGFVGALGWGIFAILFVVLYICFFQDVLPSYDFHIRGLCRQFDSIRSEPDEESKILNWLWKKFK